MIGSLRTTALALCTGAALIPGPSGAQDASKAAPSTADTPIATAGPAFFHYTGEVNDANVARLLKDVAAAMQRARQNKVKPDIHLVIDSTGGSLKAATYAYNVLRAFDVPITTHNWGEVQSSALLLYLAGASRECVLGSQFLAHSFSLTRNLTNAPKEYYVEAAAGLDMHHDAFASIIASRTKADKATALGWFKGPTYFTVEAALQAGICTQKSEPKYPPNTSWVFYP